MERSRPVLRALCLATVTSLIGCSPSEAPTLSGERCDPKSAAQLGAVTAPFVIKLDPEARIRTSMDATADNIAVTTTDAPNSCTLFPSSTKPYRYGHGESGWIEINDEILKAVLFGERPASLPKKPNPQDAKTYKEKQRDLFVSMQKADIWCLDKKYTIYKICTQ